MNIQSDRIIFNNGKTEYSKNNKKYLELTFSDIYGYANTLYGMEELPWKLDPILKPSEFRCFKLLIKIDDSINPVYFCVENPRQDWERKGTISLPEATYVNNLWVSILNYKIHLFNLKHAKETMIKKYKHDSLDCNSHVMEPIKYQYRNEVI